MIDGLQQAATKTSATSSKVGQVGGSVSAATSKGAGMTGKVGKGFSTGMKDLVGALDKTTEILIERPVKAGVGGVGNVVGGVGKVGGAVTGAVGSAAKGIGNSGIGKMAGEAAKQGKKLSKIAGVGTSIASLLRQSQLFTGVIGMIFQIVGAFIDILLMPFMPLVTMAMRLVAKLLPPMMKVSMFLMKITQWYADLLEKFYSFIFSSYAKLLAAIWDGIKWVANYLWDAGLKKVWDWVVGKYKESLAWIKTVPAKIKAFLIEAKNAIVAFFTAIPAAISGILASVGEFLTGIGTALDGAWNTARDWVDTNIRQKLDDAITWTGTFFTNIATAISDGWTTATTWFKTNIVDKIGAFFTSAGTFFTNIGGTIKDNIVAAWDGVKDFFTSTVPDAIKTAFGFVTQKIGAIFDFFATVFAPIGNFVQGVLNKISGYILNILGFMGNIDRFGIGKAVRGTMGFDDKETFNRMIKTSRTDLDSQKQSNQIELIIKQEGESAQRAIAAANRQSNTFAMKQQQKYDLELAEGMP